MAHLPGKLEREHIAHQRLVLVGRVKHPILFLGQAEQRHFDLVSLLVHGVKSVGLLRQAKRTVAPKVNRCEAVVIRFGAERGTV